MEITLNNITSEKCKEICRIFLIDDNRKEIYKSENIKINNEEIILINGASGTGKTTFAKDLARTYRFIRIKDDFQKNIPIIDVFADDLAQSMFYLNVVGLAEPFLYLTSYDKLSTGQQFRFLLAYMISLGEKKIFIDEFCSYLDRKTAQIVAYNFQKVARKLGVQLLLVTAHDDLASWINPDMTIVMSFNHKIEIICSKKSSNPNFITRCVVESGTINDYRALEHFHYADRINEENLTDYNVNYFNLKFDGELMGVMIIKCPYTNNQEDSEFIYLNEYVGVVHRIILHPMVRGLGLTKLFFSEVRKKLNYKVYYAASALALYIPFFEKNGFLKIGDFQYHQLPEYKFVEEHLATKDKKIQSSVLDKLNTIFSKYLFWEYDVFCEALKHPKTYTEADFNNFIKGIFSEDEIREYFEIIKFFRMGKYVYK